MLGFLKKLTSQAESYDATQDIRPWFKSKGINPSTVRHFVYDDPVLVKNLGATIMVGLAKKDDGSSVGFVFEVIPGEGVVEGIVLQPSGTATYHKQESQYAKMNGMTLIDRLQQKNKAAQEENKKAGHTEAKYIGEEH
jgi:hypothetical protein